jgi:hypothetical protein
MGAFVFFIFGTVTVTPAFAGAETVTIAAGNSLRDALRQQHPDIEVRVIYGPSQRLRKQIEDGAPKTPGDQDAWPPFFVNACRLWLKLGFISFGGEDPA